MSASNAKPIKINGELLNQLPEGLFIPPDALEVFLESFEGPLDLLLFLIRKQNIDILDIPIAVVTEQYMQYVELMRKIRLDLAAEYLLMAAMLAQIKSRFLLPRAEPEGDDEEDDPRAALVRQLQIYEQFQQAARDIDELPRMERDFFLSIAEYVPDNETETLPYAELNDLVVAFRNVMLRAKQNKGLEIFGDALSLRERMVVVLEKLNNAKLEAINLTFEDLFEANEGREGLVVTFMAILELMRDGLLNIVQNRPYSPIHIATQ